MEVGGGGRRRELPPTHTDGSGMAASFRVCASGKPVAGCGSGEGSELPPVGRLVWPHVLHQVGAPRVTEPPGVCICVPWGSPGCWPSSAITGRHRLTWVCDHLNVVGGGSSSRGRGWGLPRSGSQAPHVGVSGSPGRGQRLLGSGALGVGGFPCRGRSIPRSESAGSPGWGQWLPRSGSAAPQVSVTGSPGQGHGVPRSGSWPPQVGVTASPGRGHRAPQVGVSSSPGRGHRLPR